MYFKSKDIQMYYEKYGNGNDIMLILPGWGETRKTFNKIIEYYKNIYTIYIMDYPGFGNTKFPSGDLTIYDYALLIKEFMISEKISNPVLLAHSFGGRIAIILTGYFNIKKEKMILMDIAGIRRKSIKRWLKQKIYKFRKKCNVFLPKRFRKNYLKCLKNKYGSTDYNSLGKNMIKTFTNVINEDLRKYVNKISSEVLLIWGMRDIDTPLKDGYFFNKKIKDSALIIFPYGTHFTYLEYHIQILSIIDCFVNNT